LLISSGISYKINPHLNVICLYIYSYFLCVTCLYLNLSDISFSLWFICFPKVTSALIYVKVEAEVFRLRLKHLVQRISNSFNSIDCPNSPHFAWWLINIKPERRNSSWNRTDTDTFASINGLCWELSIEVFETFKLHFIALYLWVICIGSVVIYSLQSIEA